MAHRHSPHRRRSISVLNQGEGRSSVQQQRRRAYSIVPGEKLSPAAKTRRIMVPRKSILKPPPTDENTDDVTQSMEFTEIHHSQPRKSLGRRVSFASHAHVRLFEVRNQNANGSMGSSPSPERQAGGESEAHDEGSQSQQEHISRSRRRSSQGRRRSSVAFSEFGEQSMDMDSDDTGFAPEDFLNEDEYDGVVGEEGEFSEEDNDFGSDMDLTEAVPQNAPRRKSSAMGPRQSFVPQRRRSSIAPIATSSQFHSENQPPPPVEDSFADDTRMSQQEGDITASSGQSESFVSEGSSGEPMEFTVPINRALRPAEQNEAWQQLRAATHAGIDPLDNDSSFTSNSDAELTDALNRMLQARESIGLPPHDGPLVTPSEDDESGGRLVEDSFTSSEDSFSREVDQHDLDEQTMNVTTMIRSSLGSAMDETSLFEHANESGFAQSSALREREQEQEQEPPTPTPPAPFTVYTSPTNEPPARPPIFSVPSQLPAPGPPSTDQRVFSAPSPAPSKAAARPLQSPSKPPAPTTVPKPFTFSFRPPPRTSVPGVSSTPSKSPAFRGTAAFAPPSTPKSPRKRPAPEDANAAREDGPSSPKKQATGKLTPSKKPGPSNVRRTSIRRPSGFLAQRKSLGGAPPAQQPKASPKKLSSTPKARASLPSTPSKESTSLYPDVSQIMQEELTTPSRARSPISVVSTPGTPANAAHCERETFRQSIVEPSPTRGSPSPVNRVASPVSPRRRTMSPLPPVAGKSASPATASSVDDPSRRASSSKLPPIKVTPADDRAIAHEENYQGPTPTEQWREGVEDDGLDDEGPSISIEQFFEMTGIRFMEEITAPRRSMVHPSQPRPSRRRSNASQTNETDEVPLAEFVNALAVDLPQLELYSTIASELSAWIEESKKICRQADEEAVKVTPSLFREFTEVDDTEREYLLHQLKLIKANNHSTAKSQWYDWKKEWVGQLRETAETAFSELESDASTLEGIINQTQDMLPSLRDEYAQVMKELEQEKADIAEIENSDQDYLNELKATIAEQDTELEAFRADVSEAKAKLDRLQEKLGEIESQRQETTVAIAEAKRVLHVQKESTSVEVFRLKGELEALENLHLWRITSLHSDIYEFIYSSRYHIRVPSIDFQPVVSKLEIKRTKESLRERDPYPQFTQLNIDGARQFVLQLAKTAQEPFSVRHIVEHLSDFWNALRRLRVQLTFLAIKFPLSVQTTPTPTSTSTSDKSLLPTLKVTATVLFPSVKTKALISFILDSETYSSWPSSIGSLQCEVKVAYGRVKSESILEAVQRRLAQATPSDNHGCLLDACIEATEQYESQ